MSLATDLLAKFNRVPEPQVEKVRGVNWREKDKRWVARIYVNGQQIVLGYFRDYDDAVKCRQAADVKYGPRYQTYVRKNNC